ncbi:hypothetical protein [Gallaecimonas pentaromativorans]|uniref:hypothetical protein n=1 Tax=Gallaecimonas pentaromativorans TaxID=584787 RepID=UPI003A8C8FE3
MQISKEGIRDLCEAIFAFDNPFVVEAYSEFDKKPLSFSHEIELEKYISEKIDKPKGMAYIFVVYPEMAGKACIKKINLNSKKVSDRKFRYTWEGWGLIAVQIASPDLGIKSNINANSEARAKKWENTYSEFEPPSTWNWKEVTKHKNRLKRVLKKHA